MHQSRRLLFYTLCLIYIGTGISTILPGPALPLLAAHTQVSLDIAGWTFTAGSLGFVVGVMLAGLLNHHIGTKAVMVLSLAILCVGVLIIPWTHIFGVLLAAQFVVGISLGAIDIGVNVIATLTFQDTLGETLNKIHSAFGIGALIGPLLLSLSLQFLNEATWAFAMSTLIAACAIILLLQQRVPTLAQPDVLSQQDTPVTRSMFTHLVLWLMALQMFLYIGAEGGFGNWITTAISQSALVSLVIAAPSVTAFWLGLTGGRLLSGQLLKLHILNEHQLLFLSALGGGLSGLAAALFTSNLWLSFTLSFLFGLFLGPLFPVIMSIASRYFIHALGMISSVMLFGAGASGFVLPVLVGIIITHVGIGWGMAIPALCCLLIIVPFTLAVGWRSLLAGNN